MPLRWRLGVTMFEEVGNVEQLSDFHLSTYLLLALALQSLFKRLSRILGSPRQGIALSTSTALLAQQQNLLLLDDKRPGCVSYSRYQFRHSLTGACPVG